MIAVSLSSSIIIQPPAVIHSGVVCSQDLVQEQAASFLRAEKLCLKLSSGCSREHVEVMQSPTDKRVMVLLVVLSAEGLLEARGWWLFNSTSMLGTWNRMSTTQRCWPELGSVGSDVSL